MGRHIIIRYHQRKATSFYLLYRKREVVLHLEMYRDSIMQEIFENAKIFVNESIRRVLRVGR